MLSKIPGLGEEPKEKFREGDGRRERGEKKKEKKKENCKLEK